MGLIYFKLIDVFITPRSTPYRQDLAVFHHDVHIPVFLEAYTVVLWQHFLKHLVVLSGHESGYGIARHPACAAVGNDAFDDLRRNAALLYSGCCMCGDLHFS